jgi:hypothetical protein
MFYKRWSDYFLLGRRGLSFQLQSVFLGQPALRRLLGSLKWCKSILTGNRSIVDMIFTDLDSFTKKEFVVFLL